MLARFKRALLGEMFDPFAAHELPPIPNCEYLSWNVIGFVRAMTLRYNERFIPQVFSDYLDDHDETEWAARLRSGAVAAGADWLWERTISRDVPARGWIRSAVLCSLLPVSLAFLEVEGRIDPSEAAWARAWARGERGTP